MKPGNLNFLEPSGPLQACNGTASPFTVHHQESEYCIHSNMYLSYWLCWLSASKVRMELTSLADSITCMTNTYCCVYSTRLLMMNSKPVWNMESSIPKWIWEIVHLVGFYYKREYLSDILHIFWLHLFSDSMVPLQSKYCHIKKLSDDLWCVVIKCHVKEITVSFVMHNSSRFHPIYIAHN